MHPLTGQMEPHGTKNGWIFLRSPRIRSGLAEPLHQVLDHEIVHILLGRAFAHYPVPRWLQEGVAQVVAGEYTPSKVQQLGTFAEPMSFLELAKGFPADALRARMAYAQSASLVAYLFQEHGTQSLQILIEEMSQGRELDVALVRATGMTPQELDVAWRGRTLSMPLWLQSVSIDGTLLALVALVILLGSTRKYKQYRQGNHLWDEEERVHQQLIQRCPPGTVRCVSKLWASIAPLLFRITGPSNSGKTTYSDGTHKTFKGAQPQRRQYQTFPSQTGCGLSKRWSQTGCTRPKPNRRTGPNDSG